MERLNAKHVLISGASRGLGRQLALDFSREGAAALALCARNFDSLRALKREIDEIAPGANVIVIEADMSRPADIERLFAVTLSEFHGRLDVLINNASALGPAPMPFLLDYPLEDFQAVLNTNLVGPYLAIREALPAMFERGGSIINVTSDAGIVGYPGWGAYGISKFGLEGLSQTWAAELAETQVRVNWVDPGSMNTAMHRAAEPDEDPEQWADPADVTEVFIYLASDESKGVTGRRFEAQKFASERAKNHHVSGA
jgi:NAD(P)-dependent dehydrogenase (short-subunit alcohol dehydrogenase family)